MSIGGRPAIPVTVQRGFWIAVRSGLVVAEAAAAVGVSKTVAWRWVRHVGGVMPEPFRAGRPVVGVGRLSFQEREEISCRRAAGEGVRAIARVLGRSPSTISRSLVLLFPDDPAMRVSHATIYRNLYVQGRGGLRRELVKCLRTGRALRKTRRTTERRGRLAGMVNIAERPAEADDRAVPGHWEGDLITGKEIKSAIGTLVERSTGYLMLLHLPDRYGADDVQHAMIDVMSRLPQTLRRTLTWDQGQEMANHAAIADAAELEIYFCDPHSPWQRASNENTNGLLRQYFPKSTDLSGYHRDYLEFVAAQMNNRPRKRLGWRTPAEALDRLLSEGKDPPGVALTG